MSQTNGHLISLIVGKILALIASLLTPMVLTRFLSMEDYGLYGQFYTLLLFAVGIASMGIHTSLYFLLPNKDSKDQKKLIIQSLSLLILMGLIAVGIFKIPTIRSILLESSGLDKYALYFAIAIVLSVPLELMQPLYIVSGHKKLSLFYPICVVVLKTICIIGLAIFGGSIASVFLGVLIAISLTFLFVISYVYRQVKNYSFAFDFLQVKNQLAYSLPFGLAVALKIISLRFDKVISVSVLTSMEYAVYIVAYYGIPGINEVFDSLAQTYSVRITKLYKDYNIKTIVNEYKNLTCKTLSYTIPIALIIGLYANQIIELLFSKKYLDATPYFRIYLITVVLSALGAGLILRSTANTKSTLKAYFISSLFTIPISYFLIQGYGLLGAIVGAVLGCFIPVMLLIRKEMKVLHTCFLTHFDWSKILIISFISLICYIPFVIINHWFETPLVFTIILGALYLLLVAIMEIKFRVFIISKEVLNEKLKSIGTKVKLLYKPI